MRYWRSRAFAVLLAVSLLCQWALQTPATAWGAGGQPGLSSESQPAPDPGQMGPTFPRYLDFLSAAGGRPPTVSPAVLPPARSPADPSPQYVTVPGDFPAISVTSLASGTADGDIFAGIFAWDKSTPISYLVILDNQGQPVYYQKMPNYAHDFTVLPNGNLAYYDWNRSAFIIMDSSYREIDMIKPAQGYQANEHELQLLPNGHYLWLVDETRIVDMSKLVANGNPRASVTGQVIQELDQNKHVVFEWHTLDYIPVTDSDQDLTAGQIDYTHSNAVQQDTDGNLLLSSRHLDEIIKINRQTGAIMWRLGGKENQFVFLLAPGVSGPAEFYKQHDVRRLPDGHISIFDNHNDHQPQVSRALEYVVDETAKTATLVWAYNATAADFALAMGNLQRLPNGNAFIDWGSNLYPNITELKPDGTKALEIDFGKSYVSYRAFRFPWHGYPTWPPALVLRPANNALELTFSWNGATEVSSYQVYGGNSPSSLALLGVRPKTGFETTTMLQGAQAAFCFYRIVPVDLQGKPMGTSAEARNGAAGGQGCS